jgi:hypothetical protein
MERLHMSTEKKACRKSLRGSALRCFTKKCTKMTVILTLELAYKKEKLAPKNRRVFFIMDSGSPLTKLIIFAAH